MLAGLLAWQGALLLVLGPTGTITLLNPTIDALTGPFLGPVGGWALAIVALGFYAVTGVMGRRRRTAAGLDLPPVQAFAARIAVATVIVAVSLLVLNGGRRVPPALPILPPLVVFFHYIVRPNRFGRFLLALR